MKTDRALAGLAGIGIIFVVLGHSGPMSSNMAGALAHSYFAQIFFGPVHDWIYSFHMPLFFFMAGYSYERYSSAKQSGFGALVRGKGLRLIIPYAVLTTLWFPLKALLSRYAMRPVSITWRDYATRLVIPWNNVVLCYWFLPTLFLIFVIHHVLVRLTRGQRLLPLLIFPCAIVAYFAFSNENRGGWQSVLNIGGVLHNYVFFCIGALFVQYQLEAWVTRLCLPLTPLSIAIFTAAPPGVRRLHAFLFGMALMNIWGLWGLVHRLKLPGVADIGDYSFTIYLWSYAPQLALAVLADGILHLPVPVTTGFTFIGGLCGPLALARSLPEIRNPIVAAVFG